MTGVEGLPDIIDNVKFPTYGEIVNVNSADALVRQGQILEINKEKALVQAFEGTSNIDNKHCHIECTGDTLKMPISDDLKGRSFNGSGKPLDKGPAVLAEEYLDINGASLNPKSRVATNSASQVGSTTENNFSDTIKGNIKAASSRRLPDLHQHSGNNFDAMVDDEAVMPPYIPLYDFAAMADAKLAVIRSYDPGFQCPDLTPRSLLLRLGHIEMGHMFGYHSDGTS